MKVGDLVKINETEFPTAVLQNGSLKPFVGAIGIIYRYCGLAAEAPTREAFLVRWVNLAGVDWAELKDGIWGTYELVVMSSAS